ncbi:hypothetical protein SODALDRAFT_300418 [Sodiomyces alkalinus F11]|uniref:Uncharacterized protein n=1 Tax=Sodiomyces alkalinus (strain CBS 110278 / VKM F-3762 / F11) TaxID=1314773 RepID=A0A3N2PNL2_SODAK|nr:hypothetical protein SODALDRAFT_300418 [Sodiomyces alkalinus F11]ROT36105.1 hypothetical protein SODALDRAFT_300418 [Sodiomyces alkalinus F11]
MTDISIARSSLVWTLQGVAAATKTPEDAIQAVIQRIPPDTNAQDRAANAVDCLSFEHWQHALASNFQDAGEETQDAYRLVNIALAVSFLREASRQGHHATPDDLTRCWDLIRGALTTSDRSTRHLFTASRSAQGFLAVPLCSIIQAGRIQELFRLHVWLPDGKRGDHALALALHSHQPFAQSWILAGEGKDKSYRVEPAGNPDEATHAGYALVWNDGKSRDAAYKTHQTHSTVEHTGRFFRATETASAVHTRNMTYSIPANAFHASEVAPDALHATLFFFDAQRGFVQDAGVLGPKDGTSFTQVRDDATVSPSVLARTVDAIRAWEGLVDEGRQHAQRSEWEHALRAFNAALILCQSDAAAAAARGEGEGEEEALFPNVALYRQRVMGELGKTNRRFGRYETATQILEHAVAEMGPSAHRVELSGELGVNCRHMNRLEDARRAFEHQYDTAKQLGLETEMCRAIGNLGMVHYQLAQRDGDGDGGLLDLAIRELEERVATARRLRRQHEKNENDVPTTTQGPSSDPALLSLLKTWETIGLARLSTCHYARGAVDQAALSALESLRMTHDSSDATVKAMSRFFYGRALLRLNRRKEALSLFNLPGTCSPAIALAKEPSDEHRSYLRELVAAGADMDIVDEQGYTALDHAVFNADVEAEALVLQGLAKNAETKIAGRRSEARLRKGYRELFQDLMRPVLLRRERHCLRDLRRAYADALAADDAKRAMFDGMSFLPWPEFAALGRLPGHQDGLRRKSVPGQGPGVEDLAADVVIFISYRWINETPGATSPDDENHTQYQRMKRAVEGYLQLHPSVDPLKLGIWMDHACVDQEDPSLGVAALPMIIAQCDAMISLVDDQYYKRGWCAVEVLMAQTLRNSYGNHHWYEQLWLPAAESGDHLGGGGWHLREGANQDIVMKDKLLTYEEDRSKVVFLERQSKLLG